MIEKIIRNDKGYLLQAHFYSINQNFTPCMKVASYVTNILVNTYLAFYNLNVINVKAGMDPAPNEYIMCSTFKKLI